MTESLSRSADAAVRIQRALDEVRARLAYIEREAQTLTQDESYCVQQEVLSAGMALSIIDQNLRTVQKWARDEEAWIDPRSNDIANVDVGFQYGDRVVFAGGKPEYLSKNEVMATVVGTEGNKVVLNVDDTEGARRYAGVKAVKCPVNIIKKVAEDGDDDGDEGGDDRAAA